MILGMSRRFAPFSFLLQALLVWFLCSGAGAAPRFEDSMAQRVLACTACHGDQGRAGPDGYYPRLAGKPAGYLHHQLLNFRDGRRHYGLMTRMVDPLSDWKSPGIFRRWNCPTRRQRPSPPRPRCCAVARCWRARAMRRAACRPVRNATAHG